MYDRIQRFYPIGKDLSIDDWNKLSKDEGKSKILVSVRNDIKNTFEKVESAVKSLIEDDRFTFDALNLRLGKGATDTLNTAFSAKMDALKNDGAIGNMLNYQSAIRSVELFAGEKICFNNITVEWLKRYEDFLLKQGKSYVTVSMYIRCIRAIMNEAKRGGLIKENQYPFGKDRYEIPTGEGRKSSIRAKPF